MRLALDGESEVREAACEDCGRRYLVVSSFLLHEGEPYAVAKTALHHHGGREAWIDVVLGTWDGGNQDHTTFGCRVGPVTGSPEPAATAVDAARVYGDAPFWGRKLTRAEALVHPRLGEFWHAVDFLLEHEPAISHHIYHG